MWNQTVALGVSDTGIGFYSLPLWAMAGLGMAMAFYSSRKERMTGLGIAMAFYSSRKEQRQEHYNVVNDNENENGINRLPNDILCNIVSRLKPIEASRTSILCSRWRNIWTLNPQLRFSCLETLDISECFHDHVDYGDRERFLNAVNQCLKLYSRQKLKIFFMRCCFLKSHTSHLEGWMRIISSLDVEELYLDNSCPKSCGDQKEKAFAFSFKLIKGLSRLRKLDLSFCNVKTDFLGRCDSLVNLSLGGIPLLNHDLSNILLFCPNLRSLFLEYCELPMNLRTSGPNLKLESLEFRDCSHVQKLDISDCYNLVTIMIVICSEVEIMLSSVPKLERLHLQTPEMNYSFGDVPNDLPWLKFLSIQTTNQISWLPPTFEVFGNVRILYLLTKGDNNGKTIKEVDLWNFAPVLDACPLLEKFYLMVGGPICVGERKWPWQWHALRHKHLKYMELSGFSNTQNELEFAKFILTSAEALHLLLLTSSFRRCDGRRSFLQGEKDLIQRDEAREICAKLQVHALSMRARVEMC